LQNNSAAALVKNIYYVYNGINNTENHHKRWINLVFHITN